MWIGDFISIRLPREYVEIIGLNANIYKTDREGRAAFLIVPQLEKDGNPEQNSRVSKLNLETAQEYCISQLESQIAELKNIILKKESESHSKKENQRPRARFEPASWPPQGHRITRLPHLGVLSSIVPCGFEPQSRAFSYQRPISRPRESKGPHD